VSVHTRGKILSSPPARATITQVAERAGVSHQTVSRVLNEHPNVAPATRERVLRAMRDLDYHPNRAARSLASQRSSTLGVVSFGITYYGPAQMVANIEQAARERGYGLVFVTIPSLSELEIERALLELRNQFVDGVLLLAPLVGVAAERIGALCRGVPFVLVDVAEHSGVPGATIDQFAGGCLAADHLVELGHERIAFLSGPGNWHDARQRRRGWEMVLKEAGLRPVGEGEGDWSAASGHALTHDLITNHPEMTALLVGNDQMALGALRALHERGVAVPTQVSVVGFDDVPESRFYYPPLTTVRQDFAALGRESLGALVEAIESSTQSDAAVPPRVIRPELVVRASTAPAREA
jgi:DNA-binding LacI/PurR family transcriptional regulator